MGAQKFYWLKLKKDFFKRHDIKILEGMPNGKEIVLFYLKLLCESVDHDGELRFSDSIPYTARMLASVTNTELAVAEQGIKILEELGMLVKDKDETIIMKDAVRMLGCESAWAEKKKKQRELPILTNGSKRLNAEIILLPNGKRHFVDEKRYGGNGMLVLDRAMGKCEICGSEESIMIHHANGYSNEPEDLLCVCSQCHGKLHSKEGGGNCPPSVLPLSSPCPPSVPQMSDKSIEKEKEKDIRVKKEREKEKEREKDGTMSPSSSLSQEKKKRFVKPTVEEVKAYCEERGNGIDPQTFVDYYEAKGWTVGKNAPIKDWKACVRTWENRRKEDTQTRPSYRRADEIPYMENDYDFSKYEDNNESALKELNEIVAQIRKDEQEKIITKAKKEEKTWNHY